MGISSIPFWILCALKIMCLPLCRTEVNRKTISVLDGKAVGGDRGPRRDPEEGGGRHQGHRKIQVDLDLNGSPAADQAPASAQSPSLSAPQGDSRL